MYLFDQLASCETPTLILNRKALTSKINIFQRFLQIVKNQYFHQINIDDKTLFYNLFYLIMSISKGN